MAIDIFDQGYSDHIVFDRIVDCDRTITLARQAAAKAEAAGQHVKAAKLREKADYLEELLSNTQSPDYSDEEEGEPPVNNGEGTASNGGKAPDSGDQKSDDDQSGPGDADTSSEGQEAGESSEGSDEGDSGETKKPEDIAALDQHNGTHSAGTNRSGEGGPKGDTNGGSGSSGSGEGQGDPKNQAKGQSKGKGQSKELDPFRTSRGQSSQQQKQPTPEEILEAIIKRLSGLTGEARKGADKGLQDYFNDITGGGSL